VIPRSCRRSFHAFSHVAVALLLIFGPFSLAHAEDDLEARREECKSYAKDAKEDVEKYIELKCTDTKNSARWNPDEGAHFSWCFLLTESDAAEADFGTREAMIAKARGDRKAFLATCKESKQGASTNDQSTEEVEFKCPDAIGARQFRPQQIKKYFSEPVSGSYLGSVTCDYYLEEGGSIRLTGQWLANYVEWPVSTQEQLGCDRRGGTVQEVEAVPGGMHVNSDDRHAIAHMTGDTKAAVDLIFKDSGPLDQIFIFAHLRARTCN